MWCYTEALGWKCFIHMQWVHNLNEGELGDASEVLANASEDWANASKSQINTKISQSRFKNPQTSF